ncbi:MAG: GDSL-type esterase/lipase family protein [Pirellulales bacterium]
MKENIGRARLWTLRLITVALALLPFLIVEITLRAFDWPSTPPPVDPLINLHHLKPLFKLDAEQREYFVPPERMNLFREARFAAKKTPGTFRIFCVGGSTTQGEPYSTQTAFGAWLQIDLQTAAGDSRKIEVINCGGLSYASYRVLAILREVLQYEPDLIIVDVGHNEFLEKRTYDGWDQVPLNVARTRGFLQDLRMVQVARLLIESPAARNTPGIEHPTQMASEVDALLDYAGGLDEYHRDDAWREPVVSHMRWNLEAMIDACSKQAVPIMLIRPVVNLLDCPPMKFETSPKLDADQRSAFEAAWSAARESGSDAKLQRKHLEVALEIDPEHAGALFLLGRLQYAAREWDAAEQSLRRAKDADVCPLRALTEIQDAIAETAAAHQVPLMDADRLFQNASSQGIVGRSWLVDHIHPGVEGHQLLGNAMAELVLQNQWVHAEVADWRNLRKAAFQAHLSSLNEDYFHRGKQRLEGLLLWTQGQAKRFLDLQP